VSFQDHGQVWTRWASSPPPRNTFVIAQYERDGKELRVQTCKRGCCVDAGTGCMFLPDWWRATDDQGSPLPWSES
jgi:hypothetical protein